LFAEEGAKLVLGARRKAELKNLTQSLEQSGAQAVYLERFRIFLIRNRFS
jgi:NADP-dependent 3-hydroxy acid dehydrogenase YdfG